MPPQTATARAAWPYVAAAILSTFAVVLVMRLWRADLHIPFDYGGDSLLNALPVKSIADHGWYLTNDNLGAPNGLSMQDYPFVAGDTFHLLAIRFMALFSRDWAVLFNLYFLLGFPLTALSATAVFRHFGARRGPAVAGAVLYSFLPGRLLIGEQHIFLNVFYQVPLAIMVVLWVCGDAPPLVVDRGPSRAPGFELGRSRSWGAVAICVLTAMTGLYYAYFVCCLLVLAGVWASLERRSPRNALAGVALAATIVGVLMANGLPMSIYHRRHGPNPEVAVRKAGESEVYGMKLAQLLLPVDGHRLPALRKLKERYDAGTPLLNENTATSLGLVGSLGFLALLGALLLPSWSRERGMEPMRPLAILNVGAVLLATVGGIGSMIALLVTPQIRTYARMSVIIGFLSLFAVVVLLDRLVRHRPRLGAGVVAAVLAFGLLDQTTAVATRLYWPVKRLYLSDDALVHRIEDRLPPGAVVFQLPYISFPEAPGRSYDCLRPYLHSRSLRWTLPTMRGRSGDRWARDVAALEPHEMLRALADADVRGLLIDRTTYPEHGAKLEAAFTEILGSPPLPSANGEFAFYVLPARQTPGGADAGRDRQRQLALHPLVARWTGGLTSAADAQGPTRSRWYGATGELHVDNEAAVARTVALRMTLAAARPPARLTVDGPGLRATADIGGAATSFARTFELGPGYHVFRFRCDGKPLNSDGGDGRAQIWRVDDASLDDVPPP